MAFDLNTLEAKTRQVAVGCSCGNLRRASRAVTQLYDGVLQASGLKATQFTLLVAAAELKSAPISQMAEALVMDRTTLTRNLKPLVKDGLLTVEPGEDRRSRWIRLTPKGRRVLAEALPLWDRAQNRVIQGLGRARWQRLIGDLKAGDHVILSFTPACRLCKACLRGQANLCETMMQMAITPHFKIDGNPVSGFTGCGTFAEEMIVPQAAAIKVADDIPLNVVSLIGCGVMTGVGAAINTAGIKPGTSVCVIGCGGVGISAIQGARIAGAAEIVAAR